MKEKKLVVVPGLTPEWLKKRNGIMRAIDEQLVLGLERPGAGLTLDQLQACAVEHRNPFLKEGGERPLSFPSNTTKPRTAGLS